MIVIGIDPGLTGALARLDGDRYDVWDTPTGKDGKRTVVLPREMLRLLRDSVDLRDPYTPVMVFLEKVHAMKDQGRASIFNFGEGYGIWQGLCAGLGLPYELVTPQRWKRRMMDGRGKEKDAAVVRVQELFPDAPVVGPKGGKKHGRADALLIAEYGRRELGGS